MLYISKKHAVVIKGIVMSIFFIWRSSPLLTTFVVVALPPFLRYLSRYF